VTEKPNHPAPPIERARVVIEELACAIANAQAALLAGRYQDLETCARRMQELCGCLNGLHENSPHTLNRVENQIHLVPTALAVQQQNKIFAAALGRMRRHLDALRNLLKGPSLTYHPQTVALPERKR